MDKLSPCPYSTSPLSRNRQDIATLGNSISESKVGKGSKFRPNRQKAQKQRKQIPEPLFPSAIATLPPSGFLRATMVCASITQWMPPIRIPRFAASTLPRRQSAIVKAAELVLGAGGFGLVVIDFGEAPRALAYASSLRIARAAERSGAAVIALAPWRMCGTFAALSLATSRAETSFSRLAPGAPVTFDGLTVDPVVARNKMGGTGRHARVRVLIDPIESTELVQTGSAQLADSRLPDLAAWRS